MSVETATFLRPCEKAALSSAGLVSLEHVVNAIPAHLARILPPPPPPPPTSSSASSNTAAVAADADAPVPSSSSITPTTATAQLQHTCLSPTSTTTTTGTVTVSPAQIEYAIKVADRCLAALQLQANWFNGDTNNTTSITIASSSAGAAEEGDNTSRIFSGAQPGAGGTSSSVLVSSNDSWADIDCTPIAIAEEIDESILSASAGKKNTITTGSTNVSESVGVDAADPPSQRQRLGATCDWLRQASIDAFLPPPPKVISLEKILNEENQCAVSKIATFARDLDAMLGGGVPLGCVTEICGAPGMGKTQMGMQLAVSAQLPASFGGLGGRCLYLDTEGSFIPSRFREIASGAVSQVQKIANLQRQQSRGEAPSLSSSDRRFIDEFSVTNILDRTRYIRVLQLVDLIAIVNGLPALVQNVNDANINNSTTTSTTPLPPIRLIVIDSIAFHFRYAMGSDFSSRARTVHTLGQTLQQHARSLGIAIVVTNQMNPAGANQQLSSTGGGGGGDTTTSSSNNNIHSDIIPPTYPNVLGVNNYGDRLVPALGDSWAQTVTSRVLLRCLSDMERRHVIGILTNQHQLSSTSTSHSSDINTGGSAQHRHFVESLQQQINELRVALLVKSSSQSRAQCFFRITERGIRNPAPDLLDAIVAGSGGGR